MDTASPRSLYDGMSSLKNKSTLACSSWKVLRKPFSHASCFHIELSMLDFLGRLGEDECVDGHRVYMYVGIYYIDQTLPALRERSLGKIRPLPAQEENMMETKEEMKRQISQRFAICDRTLLSDLDRSQQLASVGPAASAAEFCPLGSSFLGGKELAAQKSAVLMDIP